MIASKIAPVARALVLAAVLATLTASAASACECGGGYGDYDRYRHDGYDTGNYSCYGGGYDCRYESDRGYYYHDDYRDRYRHDNYRYNERYRRHDRDDRYRDDYRW